MIGLGLTEPALQQNQKLNEFIVHDLNTNPVLPLPNHSVDAVVMVSGIAYLRSPVDVFAQVARVLKPGGVLAIVFSDISLPQKRVPTWDAEKHDHQSELIKTYLSQAGGFGPAQSEWFSYSGQEPWEPWPHPKSLSIVWVPSLPNDAPAAPPAGQKKSTTPADKIALKFIAQVERVGPEKPLGYLTAFEVQFIFTLRGG